MTLEQIKERQRFYYQKHRQRTQYSTWKRQIRGLGCTPEMYAELLSKQKDLCAICKGKNKTERHLAVDHDHATGAVRGLLCQRCNMVFAQLEKVAGGELDLLREMEKYLWLHRAR